METTLKILICTGVLLMGCERVHYIHTRDDSQDEECSRLQRDVDRLQSEVEELQLERDLPNKSLRDQFLYFCHNDHHMISKPDFDRAFTRFGWRVRVVTLDHVKNPDSLDPEFADQIRAYIHQYEWLYAVSNEDEYCLVGSNAYGYTFIWGSRPKFVPVLKIDSTRGDSSRSKALVKVDWEKAWNDSNKLHGVDSVGHLTRWTPATWGPRHLDDFTGKIVIRLPGDPSVIDSMDYKVTKSKEQ